jgi:drug/metabolite transporter (DMT)-like permease
MPTVAVMLVLASAGLHVAWNAVVRNTGGRLGFVARQTLAGGVLGGVLALVLGVGSWGRAWPWLLATVAVHAVYFTALARAYQEGTLGTVYPLSRGAAVLTVPILALIWLGEVSSGAEWAGMGLVALGMGALAWGRGAPSRSTWRWTATVALTITAYSLVDSHAMHLTTPPAYIAGQYLGSGLILWVLARQETLEVPWWTAAASGVTSLLSYLLLLYAYRLAPVGPVVALRQLAPAAAPLVGWAFLGERPGWRGVLGGFGVAVGSVLIIRW